MQQAARIIVEEAAQIVDGDDVRLLEKQRHTMKWNMRDIGRDRRINSGRAK